MLLMLRVSNDGNDDPVCRHPALARGLLHQLRGHPEAVLSLRQAALDEERTVTTAVVRGVRRCVGGRAVLVSRNSLPSCWFLGRDHSKVPVQRLSEDPPPTKKIKPTNHRARAETARLTATCLDQLSGSPRRKTTKVSSSPRPMAGQCFRWSGSSKELMFA